MTDGVEISNLQLPLIKGDNGEKGDAGKIISLQVNMLASTATPTVENTGTQSEAKYVLGIPKGTGISTAEINDDDELVVTLTDGTELNLGVVVGVSITSIYLDEEYNFIATLSDGNEINIGNLETMLETVLADYYTEAEADALFSTIDETGNKIDVSINNTTYVMTITLKDKNNVTLSTGTVDLPLESVVVSGSYDSVNKKIVLTLQSGSTVEFSVADLVAGLQTEITNANKLSADLVDDTSTTNKFVTASDKTTWNAKVGTTDYASNSTGGVFKTGNYISLDSNKKLTAQVHSTGLSSLEGTYIASIGTVRNLITSKIVSSVSSSTNNDVAVGGKLFYDTVGNLETILETLDIGSGV